VSPGVNEWVAIGPSRIGAASTGVLFAIAIDPVDTAVIYVASPFCGVWKTEDTGLSWRVVGDSLPPELRVAALATDPSTPGRIYALLQAGQLYRSDDGAANWTHVDLVGYGLGGVTPAVTELIVDPSRPQVLHARNEAACWRSGDGGQHWRPTFYGSFSHLVMDQAQPDVLYASTPGGMVYQTLNGGLDWNYLSLPFSANVYDTKVALTRASSQVIYVRRQKHLEADVYLSYDGGTSWMLRSSPNIYTELIAADDDNVSTVYIAGVDFYRSDDGGVTWTIKPGAHVDHHGFARDPQNAQTIYTACDGGLYRSPDRGDSWQFVGDGLENVLLYDLAISATQPNIAIVGTQDNGTALYDGSSTVWREILGGDGGTVAIDPTNGSIMYAMNQYASSIAQSTDGGISFHNIADGLPTGAVGFNLHFQVHPTTTNILLASTGSLWWTEQPGTPWSELFTPPDYPNDSVLRSAVDPRNDIYYAATARGRLYAAASGNDWQLVFSHPNGAGFTDLVIDPEDARLIYASFGGFTSGRVYRLRRLAPIPAALDATDISNGLASGVVVQRLAVDAMVPLTIYAGTWMNGVFKASSHTIGDPPIWSSYSIGMPPAADVRALRVHPATGVMRAATYGRSAYEVNTGDPIGSLIETVGHIFFLRAHELGTGYGRPPNFLDCEVIVLLSEEPYRAFGFKLRADQEQPARTEMFDLLRAAFVAQRPVRLDYIKTGPRVGEIIRVAND
jgi:photosystem II stability/assembly factor-like uncharacterized protein